MDRFWNDMDRTLDNVGNGYRLCILGDLNGWIGHRTRAGITGAFGVPRVVEFCTTRGICLNNTYIKHRSLHKYTRVAGKSGSKEHDKSIADEEGYAAICAGYEDGEKDGMRPLRPLCCTV